MMMMSKEEQHRGRASRGGLAATRDTMLWARCFCLGFFVSTSVCQAFRPASLFPSRRDHFLSVSSVSPISTLLSPSSLAARRRSRTTSASSLFEDSFQRLPQKESRRATECVLRRSLQLQSSNSDNPEDTLGSEESSSVPLKGITSRLDRVLSTCTSAFPLFVVGGCLLGWKLPQTLEWVHQGNSITWMLASVMCATGLSLEPQDFERVYKENLTAVPLGVLCQFIIMPLAAWTVGHFLFLNPSSGLSAEVARSLYLGLVLVGCSPGGTASNLVTLIARANVALSVLLTAVSTLLAVVATPFLVQLLVQSHVSVSGKALCLATAKVILGPVLVGMVVNSKLPRVAQVINRWTPFASVLLVSLICGGVVAQSSSLLQSMMTMTTTAATATSSFLPRFVASSLVGRVVVAVVALHSLGFTLGYLIPAAMGFRPETRRTVAIEVGMQNSALAVVLAQSLGAPPLAALPGALSATAHSCLGSALATVWRRRAAQNHAQQRES